MHADYADSFPQTGRLELDQATSAEALSSLIHTHGSNQCDVELHSHGPPFGLPSLATALYLPNPPQERTAI